MHKRLADLQRLKGLPETIEACLEGPAPVSTIKFNPFGTILASGCTTGEVLLWSWSTRGVARTFTGGHSEQVTALVWSSDGRQLLSGSLDGTVVVWDVLEGKQLTKEHLDRGGITHISLNPNGHQQNLVEAQIIVSYKNEPAEILSLTDVSSRIQIPAASLDGDGRSAHILSGDAAAATGHLAVYSKCGNYIITGARGMLCLLRASDRVILDAVKLRKVPQTVTSIDIDPSGRRVLVGATDRFIRIFNITPSRELFNESSEIEQIPGVDANDLVAAPSDKIPAKEGSLLYPPGQAKGIPTTRGSSDATITLKLVRLFDAQVERLGWGACAFSPDGEHLVSAIASPEEHIIYTWNVEHGYAENTLQAGTDGAVALTWHPEMLPMQLVVVGASGKLYAWAKVMTQNWSAFAPDFETLTDNREHAEAETEFDVEPAGEENGAQKKIEVENGGADENERNEDEIIDIESWDWRQEDVDAGDVWINGNSMGGTGPLKYLPVVLPTEAVEESIEAEEEEKGDGDEGVDGAAESAEEGDVDMKEGDEEPVAAAVAVEEDNKGAEEAMAVDEPGATAEEPKDQPASQPGGEGDGGENEAKKQRVE